MLSLAESAFENLPYGKYDRVVSFRFKNFSCSYRIYQLKNEFKLVN